MNRKACVRLTWLLLAPFVAFFLYPPARAGAASLVVIAPADYQVFQRGREGTCTIIVRVRLVGANEMTAVEASLTGAPREAKRSGAWQPLAKDKNQQYGAELTVPAGGWYRLDLRARNQDNTSADAAVEHVGIGEVFVGGGQSNSTCHGGKRQETATRLVSSFDGQKWTLAIDPLPGVDGRGGSIWPLFGDALAARYKVPVGIVPVGAGGTSVRQWLPAGERFQIPATTSRGVKVVGDHEWECDGVLFDRMATRMRTLGPQGFRAMLWHQGESDANQKDGHTLPGDLYRAYLERIIRESRKQAGWEAPWFVAQTTYHSPEDTGSPDIRTAQKALWDAGLTLPGPDTDVLRGDNRDSGGKGVHLSDKGLHAHAELWVEKVSAYLDKVLAAR